MRFAVLLLTLSAVAGLASAYERTHKETEHVLLISVDGLHASDLEKWVIAQPYSHLARLAAKGITYQNAKVDGITDSFPGILALVTGGNIKAHNVYYDDSYDRSLWAPGSCPSGALTPQGTIGTVVELAENIDKDSTLLNGGGDYGVGSIDPSKLPLDSQCRPVFPHQYPQVNNIFEAVSKYGGFTAWSDKHPAYDLLNGPSNTGLDIFFGPEINSNFPGTDQAWTTNATWTQQYDKIKVDAVINWIKGLDSFGAARDGPRVPALFGFNFQAVSVAQKLPGPNGSGGYNPDGSFQAAMQSAMQFVDDSIGRIIDQLIEEDAYHNTAIVISAKHGQAPIYHGQMRKIKPDWIEGNLTAAGIDVLHVTNDDVSIIWLKNITQAKEAADVLMSNAVALGISEALYGEQLVALGLAKSIDDPRAAQVVLKVNQGVIYTTSSKKVAEHGGLNKDDYNVGLLVSGGGLPKEASSCRGSLITNEVLTRQVAPTVLQMLGIDPECLEAVQQQHTKVLPGLFKPGACAERYKPKHRYDRDDQEGPYGGSHYDGSYGGEPQRKHPRSHKRDESLYYSEAELYDKAEPQN